MPEIIDINAGASEVRRRAAAEKQYANTTVTRQYLAVIIEKYHNETVSPILLSHEERMVYLEMWPWQKAKYRLLQVKEWIGKRFSFLSRKWYQIRWDRTNKEVMERMAEVEEGE